MQTKVIKKLKELNIFLFTPQDIRRIFNLSTRQSYNLLRQMQKQSFIYNLQKGKYLLTEFDSLNKYSIYTIASNLYYPSYISFISALSFYQLTDQLSKTIFLTVVISKPKFILQNTTLQFVKLSSNRFFGYRKEQNQEDEFFIAEPEKAILDCLFLPYYSGGLPVIFGALNNLKPIDTQKLIEYALKMKSKILLKRLGFLLEKLDINIYSQIKNKIGVSYTILDPARTRIGSYNKKWKLIINLEL